MKSIYYLCLLVVFAQFANSTAQGDNSLCNIATSAIEQASKIRKLSIRKKVPCLVRDKPQIQEYLMHTINTKLPQGRLEHEELVYKSLGMIPENFNYVKGVVDLYVSQIGGYYDPDQAHYVMAAWMPAILQTTIAVHELTHAIQDQYYDLKKFMDLKLENGDELLARSSLVEGDATAVMMDYTRVLIGQNPLSSEDNVDAILMQNALGAGMMSSSTNVPQSIQSMLIFPYNSGLRFCHYLMKKSGYAALDAAFKKPPLTSEEILHPEKYIAGSKDFIVFSDSDVLEGTDADVLYRDTLGEFGISALLSMWQSTRNLAPGIAAGWGGDRLVLLKAKDSNVKTLVWKSNWDSLNDATEFHEGYLKVLKERYGEQVLGTAPGNEFKLPKNVIMRFTQDKKIVSMRISFIDN